MKRSVSILIATAAVIALVIGSTSIAMAKDNKGNNKGKVGKPDKPEVEMVDTMTSEQEIVDTSMEETESTSQNNNENKSKEQEKTQNKNAEKLQNHEEMKAQVQELKDKFREIPKDVKGKKEILSQIAKLKKEYKDNSVDVFVNGKNVKFDVPPVIKGGRTLIPVRAVMNALGADVTWDAETRTVTIAKDVVTAATDGITEESSKVVIKLQIDSNIAYINEQEVTLDVPAGLENGRTIVPLRFISEAFGSKVDWDGESSTVVIEDEDEDDEDEDDDVEDEDAEDAEDKDEDDDIEDEDAEDEDEDAEDKDGDNDVEQ